MTRDALLVQSVEKALRVLQAFDGGTRFLGLTEIATRCGVDKSAAQRFAHTLHLAGYLEKCPETRRYGLGKRLLEVTYNYLRSNPLIEAATPVLIELRRFSGQHIKLSLFDDTSVIYAIRQQSEREYFAASLVGRRVPTFCTAGGRAILAELDPARAADIVARSDLSPLTPKTLVDPRLLLEEIAAVRRQGYAVTAEQVLLGEVVIGAAVIDAGGNPVAAVHIAGSLAEWTPEEYARKFAGPAIETAQALSRATVKRIREAS
ncbi:IclR family transcriptional regulator [Skermanella mucosa]|uniref:IclR family transcriptional regulator n=1 Tax=Skermanella mucosa TaxID=1789672 RepID=UPI00192B8A02|nr:IclR family transcriptional regulator [Skermanella mucosa]UEM19114.1 IclR family transcriptional regulator [Skermanella mucosa]